MVRGLYRITAKSKTETEEAYSHRIDKSDRATTATIPARSKLLQRSDVICSENINALQLPNPSGRSEHAKVRAMGPMVLSSSLRMEEP